MDKPYFELKLVAVFNDGLARCDIENEFGLKQTELGDLDVTTYGDKLIVIPVENIKPDSKVMGDIQADNLAELCMPYHKELYAELLLRPFKRAGKDCKRFIEFARGGTS